MATPNVVIVTKEEDAISNSTIDLAGVAPCSHEEADTQIFVHARHAAEAGSKVIMVKANDTDILVIAISVLQALQNLGLQQLWVAFGQKQNLKWIPVHDLCCKLAEKSSSSMPSLAAMLFQDSVAKGRSLLGKPGMFVMRLLVSSANSAITHLWWMMKTWKSWRSS